MKLLPKTTSISAKLIRMNLLVSGTALVLACVAFFSYDLISFQQSLIRTVAAEARIVGSNSVSAILFNDKEAAQSTLAALSSSPDILGAAIVTNDGKVFAEYQARQSWPLAVQAAAAGTPSNGLGLGTQVLLARSIRFQGTTEGTVYISARLQELGQRARQYLVIAAIILLVCLALGMLVTGMFRRRVAEPIVALAEMSRAVSSDRDYRGAPRPASITMRFPYSSNRSTKCSLRSNSEMWHCAMLMMRWKNAFRNGQRN